MKSLKLVAIVITSFVFAGPAVAGRDQSQVMQQEQAVKKLHSEQAKSQQGLAGPVGPQGVAGPATKRASASYNLGHPTERVRR